MTNELDYINLDIRMDGTTTTTECDDEFQFSMAEEQQQKSAEFSILMSSEFCSFGHFIRFVEAISIEVQECSFYWEVNISHGAMHWRKCNMDETGYLAVEWYSSNKTFMHRMRLNMRQVVAILYGAFRSFAESSEYDPIRYEKLTCGEEFALVLSNASLDDLAYTLAQIDADKAENIIQYLRDTVNSRSAHGPKLSFPIEYFIGDDVPKLISSTDSPWIESEWNRWTIDQRISALKKIFDWDSHAKSGAHLRELRSKLVEDWLALPKLLSSVSS
jgi:hypothetical protein